MRETTWFDQSSASSFLSQTAARTAEIPASRGQWGVRDTSVGVVAVVPRWLPQVITMSGKRAFETGEQSSKKLRTTETAENPVNASSVADQIGVGTAAELLSKAENAGNEVATVDDDLENPEDVPMAEREVVTEHKDASMTFARDNGVTGDTTTIDWENQHGNPDNFHLISLLNLPTDVLEFPSSWASYQIEEAAADCGGEAGSADAPIWTEAERRRAELRAVEQKAGAFSTPDVSNPVEEAREERDDDGDMPGAVYANGWTDEDVAALEADESDETDEHPDTFPGVERESGWPAAQRSAELQSVQAMTAASRDAQRADWEAHAEDLKFGAQDKQSTFRSRPTATVEPAYPLPENDAVVAGRFSRDDVLAAAELLADKWEADWSTHTGLSESPSVKELADRIHTTMTVKARIEETSVPEPRHVGLEMVDAGRDRAESAEPVASDVPKTQTDPLASFSAEVQDDIVDAAESLAEKWDAGWSEQTPLPDQPSTEELAELLARRMTQTGEEPRGAAMTVVSQAKQRHQSHIIGGHPGWYEYADFNMTVDVFDVTVTQVYKDPRHSRQAQCFIVEDEYGRQAKVTVWKGHDSAKPDDWRICKPGLSPETCEPVAEGDVVDLRDFVVKGNYNGQTILESSRRDWRESSVDILSRRQDSPDIHTGYTDVGGSASQTRALCDPTGDVVAKQRNAVLRQDTVEKRGFTNCVKWSYPKSICPDWFIQKLENDDGDSTPSVESEE
jgi:hypothetical protein